MPSTNRPLSPHLQIYRLPLTAILSITHRATGVALSAGSVILVYWLVALAGGAESFARAQALLSSPLGYVVLFAFSWALFYHLCNGIRHLFWDVGRGLEVASADASARLVLVASILLTILTWIFAHALAGGAA